MELVNVEWPYRVVVGLSRADVELLTACFASEAVLVHDAEAQPGDAERWQAACAMETAFTALGVLLGEAEARLDAAIARGKRSEAGDGYDG